MVGIGKDDKPLEEDARPIVVGEFWRRVSGKMSSFSSIGELIGKHVLHAWHAAATTDAHHTDPQGCAPLWGEVSLPQKGSGVLT